MPRNKKYPEISVSVMRQDCGDSLRRGRITAEDLDAIAAVFTTAAQSVRQNVHGTIECEDNLASVGVDCGGPFNDKTGLPLIKRIRIGKPQR